MKCCALLLIKIKWTHDALSGEKLLITRHFTSHPYYAMTSAVTFTSFNQTNTNSDTLSRENSSIYIRHFNSHPSIHSQFVTVNQTDTKSYECEQIRVLYRRHFTGQHPAATMTTEVTFTTFNKMVTNSDNFSREISSIAYIRHFTSHPSILSSLLLIKGHKVICVRANTSAV